MPVYIIQTEMPYDEFMKWVSYFEQRPVGWREDLRTYYFLCTQGYKEKPSALFPSLRFMENQKESSNVSSLRGSFLHSKMMQAKGGEKLDILGEI